jgi:hypothetical protein
MVRALRGFAISVWAVLLPLVTLAFEFRVISRWNTGINVDVLLLTMVIVASLLGGAALFCIRASLRRRVIVFTVYMLVALITLLCLYPAFACMLADCP